MRRFKLKRFIWPIIGVLAVGGIYYWYTKRKKNGEEPPPVTVQVERRDIVVSVAATGDLEPLTTVDVKANVAGEIVELVVDRGDPVSRGDLIARIDPTETQSAFDQARADVTSTGARVREAQTELDRQRQTTAAQIRASEDSYQTALARVKQAESSLVYQTRKTETNILRAQEALKSAQARVRQAESRAGAQPQITQSSIDRADAEVRAAEQMLARLIEATHPQERASTRSGVAAARVTLSNDKNNLARVQKLYERGGASLQDLEAAQKSLADAQDRYDTAQAASDTLERKHGSEIAEAKARLEQAQASADTARANSVDISIAQEELEAALAAVREAEAALAAAEAEKAQDIVKLEEVRATLAQAEESRSQLRVSRANALSAKKAVYQLTDARAQTQRSQAQLDNATKNLGYTTVVSPRDGVVIDRYVEEGTVITSGRSSIAQGTNIVTLADTSQMFVLAEVDEADVGQVKIGQLVDIEIETLGEEILSGHVIQLYPRGEVIENVVIFKVRIAVDKPDLRLRPGMTAEVSIINARRKNVPAVPIDAVFQQEGESFAEVLRGEERETVPVKTGLADFEYIEIIEGLKEGDQVIVEGNSFGGMGGPGGPGGRTMGRMMRMGGRRR